MKAGLTAIIFLALVGSVSGCGQKGPLYRDAPAEVSVSEETDRPDNETDNR